jgi:hypothetical protein
MLLEPGARLGTRDGILGRVGCLRAHRHDGVMQKSNSSRAIVTLTSTEAR